jgi:hypothetical protein
MALDYKIAAIETEYNERRYRSRLEAKWAAFFDLCGWRAEYEPFDLGEWSPDFLIRGRRTEILIEVKPILVIDVPTIWKMHTAAEKSGFKGDLLLLGTCPTVGRLGWLCSNEIPCWNDGKPGIGSERDGYPREMQMIPWFVAAEFTDTKRPDFTVGICYEKTRSGMDDGMIRGEPSILNYEFHPDGEVNPVTTLYDATKIWSKAANAVRWRGR